MKNDEYSRIGIDKILKASQLSFFLYWTRELQTHTDNAGCVGYSGTMSYVVVGDMVFQMVNN